MVKKLMIVGSIAFALVAAAVGFAVVRSKQAHSVGAEQKPRSIVFVTAPPANINGAALKAAVAKSPQDGALLTKLGDYHLSHREFSDAIAVYKRALAILPGASTTWSALGEAYIQTDTSKDSKMPPDAKSAFVHALALDPHDLRSNFYLTMEKDFNGLHDQAIGEWLQMLHHAPMGSDADNAIRGAIAASVARNVEQVKIALAQATKDQPRQVVRDAAR